MASSNAVNGSLGLTNGGTGATTKSGAFDALSPMSAVGDLIYGSGATGTGTRLAGNTTATKQFLSSTGTGTAPNAPVWVALTADDLPAHSAALITSGTLGIANGGTGTGSTTANYVFAGPTSGSGAPSFRALVAGDYPAMVGASGTTAGNAGAVPGPTATDNVKFLRGDGTWATPTEAAAGAANQIQYNSGGVLTGNANFVYSGGNVGIGTTAPTAPLDVGGLVTTSPISGFSKIATFSSNINGTAGIEMRNINSGTSNDYRLIVSDDTGNDYLAFSMPGSNSGATLFGQARSSLAAVFTNTSSGSGRNLALGTFTSNSVIVATNNAERLRITTNGNVGIGTTNPGVKLSVSGGQFAGSYLSSSNGSSGTPINWNSGNVQTTSIAAGTLYLDPASMVDGAGYTLILTNSTGGSYTLSSTGYTFMCNPACPVTVTANKHTIASMIKAGTVVYVSWVKDFQ